MLVGYARVSTHDQNVDRQLTEFKESGVEKVFIEKESGKNRERPVLAEAMAQCREGDTFIVCELSRLARNTRDLLNVVYELEAKKVVIQSLKEKIDFSTITGQLVLNVLASISQFERSMILERQRQGIFEAKKRGVYRGRKKVEKPHNFDKVADLVISKQITAVEGMKMTGLKTSTFYQFYRAYKQALDNEVIEF